MNRKQGDCPAPPTQEIPGFSPLLEPPDLARGKVLQALNGQLVHWMNLVVVRGVGEGEGQQALLL